MNKYYERLQLLFVKWRYSIITDKEKAEFNNWYISFEAKPLEMLDGDTIERIEELFYRQFEKNRKPIATDEEPPPYPFPLKKG